VARNVKTIRSYSTSLETYKRVSNQLVDGVNTEDKTVIAQVDQDETNFFWVAP